MVTIMNNYYVLDLHGRIVDTKFIKDSDVDPNKHVRVNPQFIPGSHFTKPRWNGKHWEESASSTEIENHKKTQDLKFSELKNRLILLTKYKVQSKIESILPITKQMNLIREGKTDDPAFQEVDNYRKISDSIEEEINKLQTLDELMNYKIRII